MKPVFFRFNSIQSSQEPRDFHIHTNITDGTSSIEDYLKIAIQLGLKEIAFTEHVRKTSSWYPSFVDKVEQLREKNQDNIRIYYGIETKILNLDGDLDATDEMLDTAELILGSVHRFPESCFTDTINKLPMSPEQYAEIEFRLSCAIIDKSEAEILAHPGGMSIRKYNKPFPRKYLEGLMEHANRYNKVIEINSSYWGNFSLDMMLFSLLNPYVSLGSDAHNFKELGSIIQFMNKQEK